MKYTRYGEFMRIQRIKHHEVMGDVALLFNVKIPFISAVESGKRNVPEEWVDLIVQHYKLNNEEKKELLECIEESKTLIKLNLVDSSSEKRKAAIAFQRSFDFIDEQTANEIITILNRNKK